ncbi:MAG: MBL fold metallo-hydrolase [Bdellovibrionales bacterium]|nr:MBL fold metallo-hydrolase [Bdellovibrionales bacterium]
MDLITITAIDGNAQKLDGGSMYGNAPRAVWQKWTPPDDLGRIDLSCRAMLVEIGPTKILCETGIGAFFEPKLADRYGVQTPSTHRLQQELEAIGVPHDTIDYVILSHLHFDHAGGLFPAYQEHIKDKKKLLFPKAKYIVGIKAWERAESPHPRDQASFIPELTEALHKSGRLLLISNAKDLSPEIRPYIDFFESNGHTPGQLLTIVKGQKRKVIFTGDLIPGTPWMHIPITMGYDRFPEMLIDEKTLLYSSLDENKDMLFFTHDTKTKAATFKKSEKRKIVVAESWDRLHKFEI